MYDLYDCAVTDEEVPFDGSPCQESLSLCHQVYPVNYLTKQLLSPFTEDPCSKITCHPTAFSNRLFAEVFRYCFPHQENGDSGMRIANESSDESNHESYDESNDESYDEGYDGSDYESSESSNESGATRVSFLMINDEGVPCQDPACIVRGVCLHTFMLVQVTGRPWAYFEEIRAPGNRDVGTWLACTDPAVLNRAVYFEPTAAPERAHGFDTTTAIVWSRILSFLTIRDVIRSTIWLPRLYHKAAAIGPQTVGPSEAGHPVRSLTRDCRRCVPHIEVYSLRSPLFRDVQLDVMLPLLHIPHHVDRVALSFKWADQGYGNRKGALYALYLKAKPTTTDHMLTGVQLVTEQRACPSLTPDRLRPTVASWRDVVKASEHETELQWQVGDDLWDRYSVMDVSVPAMLLTRRVQQAWIELPPEKVQAADSVLICFSVGGGGGHSLLFKYFKCCTVQNQVLSTPPDRVLTACVFSKSRTRENILSFLHRAAQEPLRRTLAAVGLGTRRLLLTPPGNLRRALAGNPSVEGSPKEELLNLRVVDNLAHVAHNQTQPIFRRLTLPQYLDVLLSSNIFALDVDRTGNQQVSGLLRSLVDLNEQRYSPNATGNEQASLLLTSLIALSEGQR